MAVPERSAACPNAATCPSATRLDDGTWMVVGRQITDTAAREHGGNPASDEGAVIVPAELVDAITQPYRERIALLEAELAKTRDVRPCGRSATHPPHRWMSARRAVQCAGVGQYDTEESR